MGATIDEHCLLGPAQAAAGRARAALLRAVEEEGRLTPRAEAEVHRALDLGREAQADPGLLRKLEAISCAMARLWHLQRDGRVNAYRSQLLRLRAAAWAL